MERSEIAANILPGDAAADAVRAALAGQPDIVAVYLFGSTARDQAHALSDADVAVLFPQELPEEALFLRTLELGALLESALRRRVDLVALNRAAPALCFQVLKYGRLLVEQDRDARSLFVMHALNRYYDAKPYLEYHNARLVARISEEGLGRVDTEVVATRLRKLDGYLRSLRQLQAIRGVRWTHTST